MKRFTFATAVLISTIVGVGMFGLPHVGAQAGFKIFLVLFLFLTLALTIVHLLYGEIISATKEKHRLVGYAQKYLGEGGKKIVSISVILGFYGSLLVYIIVGGSFLNIVLGHIFNLSPVFFNLIFFVIGAIVVYRGVVLLGKIDLIMGAFLIVIVIAFLVLGFPRIDLENFRTINWNKFFIPYGAILYSLAGLSAIPEIKDFFVAGEEKKYKSAIFLGTLIPAFLYLLFTVTVIGLTGFETTEEAISGLTKTLGSGIVFWGSLFGFLATITSFFTIGISLKETYICDYKIDKNLAWFLVCFIPLFLFILGVYNFITIITLVGALLGAIEGSAVVLIHQKLKEHGIQNSNYNIRIPNLVRYAIILVFIIGFFLTIYFTV